MLLLTTGKEDAMKKNKPESAEITSLKKEILLKFLPLMKESGRWKKIIQPQDQYQPDELFRRSFGSLLETWILTSRQSFLDFDFSAEIKLHFLANKTGKKIPYHRKLHRFTLLVHDPLRVCGKRLPCTIEVDSHQKESSEYAAIKAIFDQLWETAELVGVTDKACTNKALRNFHSILNKHFNP